MCVGERCGDSTHSSETPLTEGDVWNSRTSIKAWAVVYETATRISRRSAWSSCPPSLLLRRLKCCRCQEHFFKCQPVSLLREASGPPNGAAITAAWAFLRTRPGTAAAEPEINWLIWASPLWIVSGLVVCLLWDSERLCESDSLLKSQSSAKDRESLQRRREADKKMQNTLKRDQPRYKKN